MPPGTDLTYSWSQAASDLGQISPVVALAGFFLFGVVADLVLPRVRRGGVTAMIAVVGFAYSLGTSLYRWQFATGGYAYHRFATGDSFALFFEVLFASLGILTVALSHSYLRKRGMLASEFHILTMAAVIGMMVLASATSLVTVFLGLELLSLSLYIMCGFARADFSSQEAAAKYLLIGGFASAFVLFGMALVYGGAGTTVIPDIAQRLDSSSGSNPLILLGILLMGVGFAFKVSAAPFHMWTPDVYQGAPLPVTAFMSVGTKAAAFAVLTLLSGPEGDRDSFADLEGLARRNWLLALGMTVFMLSLAGFPPSVGFFGKLFLFTAGVGAGYTWLVVLAVLMSVVSVFYYIRVLIPVWSMGPRPERVPASFSSQLAIGLSVAASVGLGLYPTTLLI